MIIAIVSIPLSWFPISLRKKTIATSIFALIYISVLGNSNLAAVRAFMMLVVVQLQILRGRKIDNIIALTISILFTALVTPYFYSDVGWQLSITAWLLVKSFLNRILKFLDFSGLPDFARTELLSGLFGTLLLLPVTAVFFGEVNLLSPFVNLATLPIFSLLNLLYLPTMLGNFSIVILERLFKVALSTISTVLFGLLEVFAQMIVENFLRNESSTFYF